MKNQQLTTRCPTTPILLDLLFADQLDADRFGEYEPHIATCAECQMALTAIDHLAQSSLTDIFGDEPTVGEHPDEESLIAFIEHDRATPHQRSPNGTASDTPDAQQRHRAIAEHLADCRMCATIVAEMRDLFDDPIPVGTSSYSAIWTDTEYLADRARRSVGPQHLTVDTRRNRLTMHGSLEGHVPAGGLPYAPHIVSGIPLRPPVSDLNLGSRRAATAGTHDDDAIDANDAATVTPIVVDLTTSEHPHAPFVRVLLDLSATAHHLHVLLSASLLAHAGASTHQPQPSLPWRIEAREDALTTRLDDLDGMTDADGLASWSIPTPGDYVLVMTAYDEEWEIPFTLDFATQA